MAWMEGGLAGGLSRRWREVSVVWRPAQWMGLAVVAVLGLLVWLATPAADMDRHGGRGGFSGAKQPKGSAKEGTSLLSESKQAMTLPFST